MARSIRFRAEMVVVFGFEILLISVMELGGVLAVRVLRRSGRPIKRMVSSTRSRSERSAEIIVDKSTSYPPFLSPLSMPTAQPRFCSVAALLTLSKTVASTLERTSNCPEF
jgi:hypothetical protein